MKTQREREGDDIIDRTAKELISKHYNYVTSSIAAFYYIFGKEHLDRLIKYSFDYCYVEDIGKEEHKNMDRRVHTLASHLAFEVIQKYNNTPKDKRDRFRITYPTESELERMLNKTKLLK